MIAARQIFLGRGGAKLPYDAEVEYLESTGTQWIDTGFKFSAPCKFVLAANVVPVSGERDFFGAYKGTDVTGNIVCGIYRYFTFLYNRSPGGLNDRIDSMVLQSIQQDIKVECTITSSARTLIVNENTYSDSHTNYFLEDTNITLFKANSNENYYGMFRCYNFRIYDQNNNLVRDYIPVRFTNELGQSEGAMYDRVSKQLFRNQGTGAFLYGDDIVPVEYLESTGTQWIDTGVIPTATTTVAATCSLTSMTRWSNLIGCGRAIGSYFFVLGCKNNNGTARMIYGTDSSDGTYSFNYSYGTILDVVFNDNKRCYIDGVLVNTFSSNFSTSSENIMALGINQANYNSSGRVYFLKIYSNGVNSTVLRDFIPVRVGMEGAMMDRANWRVYRNDGTGTFSYGADLGKKLLGLQSA